MRWNHALFGQVIESLEARTLLSGSGDISNNLLAMYEENPTGLHFVGRHFASIETSDGNPGISVHAHGAVSQVLHGLQSLGMKLISLNAPDHVIDGYLPLSSLVLASNVKGVISISSIAKPIVNSVGSATNQADQVMNVINARSVNSVDGTGVKVGVISDSVGMVAGGLADSVASGDLPNTVHVLQDGQPGDTDEGRAMLEEIHDLAPGAALYFYSADGSQDAMAGAVTALKNAGCNIIVDDIGYPDEPMFQDGVISKAINAFVAAGGSYFSAIGNDGNSGYLRTGLQYTTNSDSTEWVNWAPSGSAPSESLAFQTNGPVDITLQWANPYNGDTGTATADLDVFIYNSTGTSLIESSLNDNIASGIPEEVLGTLNSGTYQMRVQLAALATHAQPPTMLKFVAAEDANGGLTNVQYAGIRSSGYGHAVGQSTISVGAVEFASAPPFSNVKPIHNETYSSTGPVIYGFDANGTPLSSPLTLDKPDISGIDGVNTSFFGDVMPDDPTSLPQFYGTSAAAPNVAAVAALMDQLDPGLTEAQILTALESSATPLNGTAAGVWDPQGGFGLVDATKALASLSSVGGPSVMLAPVSSPQTAPIPSESIVFNEAVTGFTTGALTLSYNGGPNLLTSAQTLTSTDQIHFTLTNLASLTAAPGSYILTLTGSGSGIMGNGIALAGSKNVTWQTTGSTSAPTVTFNPIASPTTSPIGSEVITFNEPVNGFTIAALTLTDNGGPNLLTSSQTLTSSDQIHFTLGNLGGLTAAAGTYVLTISGAGGNIMGGGQAFTGSQNVTWQVTAASGPPTVSFALITSPRTTPVDSETITFNKPVTGFTMASLSLSENLGPNLLTGAQTLTSSDQTTFVVNNLTSLTSSGGSYDLALDPTGINSHGQALASSAAISWHLNAAPTAVFAPVATPTASSISSEGITFDQPVTGFSLSNLTLTRNGGANLLTSAQTLTTSDQTAFQLNNLAALTATPGDYVLTLSPTGITGSGLAMAAGGSVAWTNNFVLVPTVTLGAVTSPRTTPISSESIQFNEAVTGFTPSNLTLTLDGGPNLLTSSQTLSSSDQTSFTLNNLAALTSTAGTYSLTLSPTGIASGSATLAAGKSITWTNDIAKPTVSLGAITTPRTTSIASESLAFSQSVTGFVLANLTLTRNGGANLLTAAQTLTTANQLNFTLNNLSALTAPAGAYVLTLSAAGITSAGGSLVSGASVSWVVNPVSAKPTVKLAAISTPRTTSVASESIVFSRSVTGFSLANLTLTRNGGANLLTPAQTLSSSNQTIFTLNNLSALTKVAGTYTLALKAGSISAGGQALAAGASLTWKTNATISGEHLFYNDSVFDGTNAAGNASDDKAIATDKSALLPGKTATFANISSYAFGLNGIMVDIAGLAASKLTGSDFAFKTGNSNTTTTWATGPNPSSIVIRPGAGTGGSTRIELIWANHSSSNSSSAIADKWLQLTVKADSNTGLASNGVFYFGSAVGLTGLSKTSAAVTSADVNAIKAHESAASVIITNVWDITRNGVVNSTDATDAQSNETSGSAILQLISPK